VKKTCLVDVDCAFVCEGLESGFTYFLSTHQFYICSSSKLGPPPLTFFGWFIRYTFEEGGSKHNIKNDEAK